jgi:hypothetical protein
MAADRRWKLPVRRTDLRIAVALRVQFDRRSDLPVERSAALAPLRAGTVAARLAQVKAVQVAAAGPPRGAAAERGAVVAAAPEAVE